jgi:hypothetical protein
MSAAEPMVAFTPLVTTAPARPIAPGPDSLLCVRGAAGPDCQVHDPARRPSSPSPSDYPTPDLASTGVPALPDLDATRAAPPPGALGAPQPGFVRGLFRPPRV